MVWCGVRSLLCGVWPVLGMLMGPAGAELGTYITSDAAAQGSWFLWDVFHVWTVTISSDPDVDQGVAEQLILHHRGGRG